MILKAVKPSPNRLVPSPKDTYQKIGPQGKPSIAEGEKARRTTGKQWTKELIEFFWTHGNTLERSVRSSTCP
jgi:hypothetical protein